MSTTPNKASSSKPRRLTVTRSAVCGALLAAFLVQSNARTLLPQIGFLKSILTTGRRATDSVSEYESQLKELKREIGNQQVVGYTASDEIRDDWHEYDQDLFLTQYALAPVVIRESTNLRLVIGNFAGSAKLPSRIESQGLTLRRDFGNGLGLYEGRD